MLLQATETPTACLSDLLYQPEAGVAKHAIQAKSPKYEGTSAHISFCPAFSALQCPYIPGLPLFPTKLGSNTTLLPRNTLDSRVKAGLATPL